MIKIGITGGIGSGKSMVASFFQSAFIPVYIADDEAKRLTHISPVIKTQLTSRFGKNIYEDDGLLNKTLLASVIFNDSEEREWVNNVIHPEVLKDFQQWAESTGSPVVALESAILFESGFSGFMDKIVVVNAPQELKIRRIEKRSGLSEKDIRKRMDAQEKDEIHNCKADFIIINDEIQPLIPQLTKVLNKVSAQEEKNK